jgi:acyl-CoA thioester hydrolase
MAFEFRLTRRVEFHETDMAGIVHFANFFRYMESVEHAFCRSLGFSVVMDKAEPPVGLPRVHASCDYRRPLRFENVVEIHLLVAEKRTRSLAYQVRFRRIEPGPVEDIAIGRLVVASVTRRPDGGLEPVPLPDWITSQVEAAPAELLFGAGPGQRP